MGWIESGAESDADTYSEDMENSAEVMTDYEHQLLDDHMWTFDDLEYHNSSELVKNR